MSRSGNVETTGKGRQADLTAVILTKSGPREVRGDVPGNRTGSRLRRDDAKAASAKTLRTTIRPSAVGIVVALAGLWLAGWGYAIGVRAAAALGGLLLAAFVLDAVIAAVWRPKAGGRAPEVTPNPARAGETVKVRFPSGEGRGELPDPWSRGWLTLDADLGCALTAHRGKVVIGPVRWVSPSPLGMWRSVRRDNLTRPLTVWPATAPMSVPPLDSDARGQGLGPLRAHLDDTSLREYSAGDDLRRVSWRSLARGGKLLTRAEEPSGQHRVVGALCVTAGADPAVVDLGASLLASWGEAMLRDGREFDVDLGGEVLHQPTRTRLLDALAGVDVAGGIAPGAHDADDALLVVGASPLGSRDPAFGRMTGNGERDPAFGRMTGDGERDSASRRMTGDAERDSASRRMTGNANVMLASLARAGLAVLIGTADVKLAPGWTSVRIDAAQLGLDAAVAELQAALEARRGDGRFAASPRGDGS